MRSRLPFFLAAVAVSIALTISGCGDDAADSNGATPVTAGATPTATGGATAGATGETAATGKTEETESGSTVGTTAVDAYNACLAGANSITDKAARDAAADRCTEAYEKVRDTTSKTVDAVKDARARCEKAAKTIDDDEARRTALAACEQIK